MPILELDHPQMAVSMANTLHGIAVGEKLYGRAAENLFDSRFSLDYKRKLLRIGALSLENELLDMGHINLVREALTLK